jgi:hypothetical protein
MRFYIFIPLLLFVVPLAFAQDTIRGSYTYTFGDKESLVEARQTCKDLALREAIESYTIFVESSTSVENFETKEDIIQSIAAGYLTDIQIIEQTEEGRTITMTVEAKVMPEEIKDLLTERISSTETDTDTEETDEISVSDESHEDDQNGFIGQYKGIEKRVSQIDFLWRDKNYKSVLSEIQKLQSFVSNHPPKYNVPFQNYLHKTVDSHLTVLNTLARINLLESQGKKIRARANVALLQKNTTELKHNLSNLQNLNGLSDNQLLLRRGVISRSNKTIERANHKKTQYPTR